MRPNANFGIYSMLATVVMSDSDSKDQHAVYAYGCELFLYTIVSTLGLLLIGIALGKLIETSVLITIFYLCQSNGGGYHAVTHMRCFFTMVSGLFIALLLISIPLSNSFYVVILFLSVVALVAFPLYLHPNKQYMVNQTSELVSRSRIITSCIAICIVLIDLYTTSQILRSGSVAMLCSSISRIYACFKK